MRTWISFWREGHNSAYHSPPSGPKDSWFHNKQNTLNISQHPLISQTITATTQNPKTSSTSHQFKSPKPNHLNQVWGRLWLRSILGQIHLHLCTCVTCFQNTMVLDINNSYRHSNAKKE